MSKQSGISSVLAAAASLLVMGMVAVGSPAQAASEEDLAAPHGSFVSTMTVPASHGNIIYVAQGNRPVAVVIANEEDAAVPHGAFTSAMTAPDIEGEDSAAPRKVAAGGWTTSLSEIVAQGLE